MALSAGQFDLSYLTHRRNILDLRKLEYLNKHHLMLTWSTSDGLESLAKRVYPLVKEAFPKRLVLSRITTQGLARTDTDLNDPASIRP